MRTLRTPIPFVLLVAVLATTACASDPAPFRAAAPTAAPTASSGATPAAAPQPGSPRSQIYAAVIRQLVTVDHTFGGAKPPFDRVLVVDGVFPEPKRAPWGAASPRHPFPEPLKTAIEGHLEDLPPLCFIGEEQAPRDLPTAQAAVIRLGPIVQDWEHHRVPASLECGSVCGIWLSYILADEDGRWVIIDRSGPLAIA
ncbi:MAG TPA: hypothetical protein VF097_02425 [Actinomycetota bacterium]